MLSDPDYQKKTKGKKYDFNWLLEILQIVLMLHL